MIINGITYHHFQAYRKAILDGDYREDILVKSNASYIDKVPNQKEGLVIFATKMSYYTDEEKGMHYTIVALYSVCQYTGDVATRWVIRVILVTAMGVLIEFIMALVLLLHKCIKQ